MRLPVADTSRNIDCLGWLHARPTRHSLSRVPRRRRISATSGSDDVPLPSDGTVKSSSEDDLRARILKAKEYKSELASKQPISPPEVVTQDSTADNSPENGAGHVGGEPTSAAPQGIPNKGPPETPPLASRVAPEPERPEDSARRLSQADFQARFNMGSQAGSSSAPSFRESKEEILNDPAAELKRIEATRGSASEAAGFLKDVYSEEKAKLVADIKKNMPNMRPEDFTEAREERVRAMGADVISVDKSYKPTVSTWGVYPRPDNISKTYGGGKTIDPTKPLEEDRVKAKRDQEVLDSIKKYRKGVGLDMDPEIKRKFKAVYNKGMKYFEAGELSAAFRKFDSASELVEWKSKLGGEAEYHKALCLDSLGKSQKAKPMYNRLTKHPNPDVRKMAKRMLFGFQAMDNLKTHTISYTAGNDYQDYFKRMTSQWDNTYFEEDAEIDTGSLLFLVSMIFLPIALVFLLTQR
ncbi:hypothetical protein BSKO_09534 [Bryopsis sp. KO-2023]|nr:hypothetical protein BSKO_09534 [Bryopsis sp. KO-2023]